MNDNKSLFFTSLKNVFTKSEIEHIWKEANHMGVDVRNDEVLTSVITRLVNLEPYQYVFGRAYFYDFELNVSGDVLIPRPETEELVNLIVTDFKGLSPKVIDIGTGSGCIALALAKLLPKASVTALDVSPKALKVAKKNAKELSLDIRFEELDILSESLSEKYDVIVSNPPYIPLSEKSLMEENVLAHEPHLALFVENENPLIFYKAITLQATRALKSCGSLYFECNEFTADDVKKLLIEEGYENVEIKLDMQGKKRIVKGENPEN